MACRIFGAASPKVADSTSARAATCSAVSRLVAGLSTLDPRASKTMNGFLVIIGCRAMARRARPLVPLAGRGAPAPAHLQPIGCTFGRRRVVSQPGGCIMPAVSSDRIEKRIVLHASRARVWHALTDSQQFGTWFGVKFDGPFKPGVFQRGVIVPTGMDAEVAKAQQPYAGMPFEITVDRIEP